jgi:hypothetical protein
MQKVLLVIAVGLGLLIAYADSRPNWDDTGITARVIFVSCGVFGVLGPKRPWLWAVAIGVWIPLLAIAATNNFGSLLALPFAFAGAYAGMVFRKTLLPA